MTEAIQATAGSQYPPATKPTIYFIGMTTGKSSIMKVFPRWAEHLNLGEVVKAWTVPWIWRWTIC
jgi:shikimate 5-dehydrogenase